MAWYMRSTRPVAATPETVYGYYTTPSTWGRWAHNTRGARASAPVAEGSPVEVQDGLGHWWTVRARDVAADRHVTYVNQLPGVTITSSYEVRPEGSGSRIEHVIEMAGPWEVAYRVLQPLYGTLLRLETRRLAALAAGGGPLAAAPAR